MQREISDDEKEIIDIFLDELPSVMTEWKTSAEKLLHEKAGNEEEAIEVFITLYRSLHNIKGSALQLGFIELGEFTKIAEHTLRPYKERQTLPPKSLLEILLETHKLVEEWIALIQDDYSANHPDKDAFKIRLSDFSLLS